jgi:lycopene cyclase domain-containing protein
MKFTYLILDLAACAVPLLFSYHRKIQFHRNFRALMPALVLTSMPFIAWDAIFTEQAIWGFNEKFITGVQILGLPVEEMLFFLCIPFACLFTYYCITKFSKLPSGSLSPYITGGIALFLLIIAARYNERAYTIITCASTACLLLYLQFVVRANWLKNFFLAYLVLLIPFAIVNGILTGSILAEEIVWYNDAENMGIRFLTIPLEDFVYAMELILINTWLFESFRSEVLNKEFSVEKL